jgi:tetratricopeptide (TPR) repeat protein
MNRLIEQWKQLGREYVDRARDSLLDLAQDWDWDWRRLINDRDRTIVYGAAAAIALSGLVAGLWVHLAFGENVFAQAPRTVIDRDIAVYRDLVAKQPSKAEYWQMYAHALIRAGLLDTAGRVIANGMTETHNEPAVQLEKAYLLIAQGRTEDAIAMAREVGKREDARLASQRTRLARRGVQLPLQRLNTKTRTEAWTLAGQLHSELGEWDGAIECFGKALQYDPNLVDVLLGRGIAHLQAGHPKLAEQDLRRALVLDPSNPAATAGLERLASQ